jgi:hypothetical protein
MSFHEFLGFCGLMYYNKRMLFKVTTLKKEDRRFLCVASFGEALQ